MALAPSLSVFRHRAYLHYWTMRQLVSGARQMATVAIAWQVYDIARIAEADGGLGLNEPRAAFLVGMVGLAQFVPVFFLSLIGGQAADRLNRKTILIICQIVRFLGLGALVVAAGMTGREALPVIFGVSVVFGAINAFTPAASNALYPTLIPRAELPNAIAWNSLGFQVAAITGPAIGGLLLALGEAVVYATGAGMVVAAIAAIATAKTPGHVKQADVRGVEMIVEGLRYVGSNKIVLGAISLDLIVVFFAGSIALLPVFARDILQIGEEGFGILRAAPAIGAAIVALILATRPLTRNVGRWMFGAVAIFGVAILIFGLSKVFWISMVALAIHGAADMISVFVRQSLIQLATPDIMKGRVSSVSFIFISASNELGEFQSGVAARFLGPVGAVLMGGCVAITAAGAWMKLFPQLARADSFEDVEEEHIEAGVPTPPPAR